MTWPAMAVIRDIGCSEIFMQEPGYRAWTKTPGGGTYYLALILLTLVIELQSTHSNSPSASIPLGTAKLTGLALVSVCSLVMLYFGSKHEEKKHIKAGRILEMSAAQISTAKKMTEEFIFPPMSVLFVAAVAWFAGSRGVQFPDGRIMVLICVTSLLTLLYPLARHLCLRLQRPTGPS